MNSRLLGIAGVGLFYGTTFANNNQIKCESSSVAMNSNKSNFHMIRNNFDFMSLLRADVILSMTVATIPFIIGGITWYQIRRNFIMKNFSNIINISLHTIQKCDNQYTMYWRTLIENDINQIILNPMGAKALQKAAKYTSPKSPIIKFSNNNQMHQYATNCNQISNQINSLCAPYWIHRNIYNDNTNVIASDIYIYGIIGMQTQKRKKFTFKKKSVIQKIYVLLIKEHIIKQMINDIGIESLNSESKDDWIKKLYDWENARYYQLYRWGLIREILKEYNQQEKLNDTIKWGRPLCSIELASFYDEVLAKTEGIQPICAQTRHIINS